MTEFKIQLEDNLVQSIGYSNIEKYLNNYINQIILKMAANEALSDLDSINLKNDDQWKIARNAAWHDEGYKYQKHLK